MSLSVVEALRDGLGRTFERRGLQLVAVFVVVRLVSAVATSTLNRSTLAYARTVGAVPGDPSGPLAGLAEAPTPFGLGLGLGGAYLLFVAVALLAEAVRIVAVRTLYRDDADGVRAADARRSIATATVNGFVAGVVVLTLVAIGLAFLVLPGVFLAVSFLFVRQEVAVRDGNVVDAMVGSWELARGNRFEVLVLVLALALVGAGVFLVGLLTGALSPAASTVVTSVVQAVAAVFGVASVTRAYRQLREAAHAEPDDGELTYEGALTADDLPPPDAGSG